MEKENYLKDGERLDDLQLNGLHIIQNPEKFCFGMDAVLLFIILCQNHTKERQSS